MAGPIPIGVGMPAWLILNEFAQVARDDFGTPVYLVGSALCGKGARDIDVRVIRRDGNFIDRFPPGPDGRSGINVPDTRWASLCRAFSALGKEMTGLPIDFQIQMQALTIDHYLGQQRLALGIHR